MNPSPNFTVSDLVGIAIGFCLFPLFLLIPGYVAGWCLDALGFRQRRAPARLAISVPLSAGISPLLAYTLWRWMPAAGWVTYSILWLAFVALLLPERRIWACRPANLRWLAPFVAVTLGWLTLGTLSLVDLQFGNKIYFSDLAYDYTFRSAVTSSITRCGIPPCNPYFFPGKPVVLRYHYFWSILCSLVNQLTGARVGPRQCVMAGTLWSGIALIAVVALYLRFFQPKGAKRLNNRLLIALGLLTVTGVNILPIALFDLFARNVFLTNTGVIPWISNVLWAPHHVAALVACLTGFVVLRYRRALPNRRIDALTCTGAGVMFASALGMSVYVTFVFAVFAATWMVFSFIKRWRREAGLIFFAGVLAVALSAPYLVELLGRNANQNAGGGHFLQWTIRPFAVTEAAVSSFQPSRPWMVLLANALLLPLNYFFELGFFFIVGVLQWRRMRASKHFFAHPDLCGFSLFTVCIALCTFLRSGVIAANDLGIRGFMLAQFVLLLWGTELLDNALLPHNVDGFSNTSNWARLSRSRKHWWTALLALGIAGTLNDLLVLRSLAVLSDTTSIPRITWFSPDHNLGGRTYALRQLYEKLKVETPSDAIFQHNPDTIPADLFHGLYADRQLAIETSGCGTVFGGDPRVCGQMIGPIRDLFQNPAGVRSKQMKSLCQRFSIYVLIVKDTDPVWADKSSWVWRNKPMLANRYARAFLCNRLR